MHCMCSHALFVSLQLDFATMMGRLLGPTTCLPHKEGGIPLGVLPKAQQASLPACFPHYPYCAKRQAGKL